VVELKTRFGGGYRVHISGTVEGPQMQLPTKRLWDQTVYNTPDSASAAQLISSLEVIGPLNILVNGPAVEDVFLKVAQEPNSQEGEYDGSAEQKFESTGEFLPAISEDNPSDDMKLSSGQDTTFYRECVSCFASPLQSSSETGCRISSLLPSIPSLQLTRLQRVQVFEYTSVSTKHKH